MFSVLGWLPGWEVHWFQLFVFSYLFLHRLLTYLTVRSKWLVWCLLSLPNHVNDSREERISFLAWTNQKMSIPVQLEMESKQTNAKTKSKMKIKKLLKHFLPFSFSLILHLFFSPSTLFFSTSLLYFCLSVRSTFSLLSRFG